MATRLGLYNAALALLGQRELASLSEPTEQRRVLDRLWDAGLVNRCLEQGAWNFAMRSVKSTDDPPAPAFGYDYRHAKPSDWVRTLRISANPEFLPLLNQYSDEGAYWYANYDELYIQYVSFHPSYGGNMAAWPESFTSYVELYLAVRAAPRILVAAEAQAVLRNLHPLADRALKNAKSKDAQNQPPESPPIGSWARARSREVNTKDND